MLDNKYFNTQLSSDEIEAGAHREFVGGMWDEIGKLQFDFMVSQGLEPHHKLLDLGCGCLRGGVRFVRYLDSGNYYGVECNHSLLMAGRRELEMAGLEDKVCHLLEAYAFDLGQIGSIEFDFALALSLFTHLPPNWIAHCLRQIFPRMKYQSPLYASVFLNDKGPIFGGIADPYTYSRYDLAVIAHRAGFYTPTFNEFDHPRGQVMMEAIA